MKLAKTKNLIGLITVVSLGFVLLQLYLLDNYYKSLDIYKKQIINYYQEQIVTTIYEHKKLSKIYFDEIINKENVLDIMAKANTASEEEKTILRNELYSIMENTYNNAKENDFRQFQFILKDTTSFLRMHRPEGYGDKLADFRESVKIASVKQEFTEGFEEGKTYNAYRFVYPLFYKNEFVGTVETSISFLAIIKLVEELFDHEGIFIIKESAVIAKVEKHLISKYYTKNLIFNDYYNDKEITDYSNKFNSINLNQILSTDTIINRISNLLSKEEPFMINNSIDDNEYISTFLPIENIQKQQVGYFIFYENDSTLIELKNDATLRFVFITILWLLVMIIIINYHFSRLKIDKLIDKLNFDKLTGAYNRNRLFEYINREIEAKKRYSNNFSIIIYDIDKFKNINDTYGHHTGDVILVETTACTKKHIRIGDYLFRIGGDEFLIILPNTTLNEAIIVAEKIRSQIEKKIYSINNINTITLSLGVAEYGDEDTYEELIKKADKMLYDAKDSGRNKVLG